MACRERAEQVRWRGQAYILHFSNCLTNGLSVMVFCLIRAHSFPTAENLTTIFARKRIIRRIQ
jgi:hypothetical protein